MGPRMRSWPNAAKPAVRRFPGGVVAAGARLRAHAAAPAGFAKGAFLVRRLRRRGDLRVVERQDIREKARQQESDRAGPLAGVRSWR